jgi:hypothetical protein
MSTQTDLGAASDDSSPGSLIDAMLVFAEPLTSGAHAIVVGDAESSVADRLLDLGARSVHVVDPDPARAARAARRAPRGVAVRGLGPDLDVRDGAFDLAVVPDLSVLEDVRAAVARLRRAVSARGAIVAMGRARLGEEEPAPRPPFAGELGPASLSYNELYDLFAGELEDVSLVGVVPFQGVVFAELGTEDEAPAVSVDARLAPAEAPSVFVVVASCAPERSFARRELDPENVAALEVELASALLRVEMLGGELEGLRQQLVAREMRTIESVALLDRAAVEREAALTRAMELEAVLAASRQAMGALERRLLEAERGCLDRDDRLAMLNAELDERRSAAAQPAASELVDELHAHVARAEAAAATASQELAAIAEAHGVETSSFEAQLADRARVIASLEKELLRREQLVKELVGSLEEAREGAAGPVFEDAPPLSTPPRRAPAEAAGAEEVIRLRRKLDELAAEVARREGELTARAWRIQELEAAQRSEGEAGAKPEGRRSGAEPDAPLRKALDEVDALRKALAQEHAARVAAESGEELARARAELTRQAALLEQMRGRVEGA